MRGESDGKATRAAKICAAKRDDFVGVFLILICVSHFRCHRRSRTKRVRGVARYSPVGICDDSHRSRSRICRCRGLILLASPTPPPNLAGACAYVGRFIGADTDTVRVGSWRTADSMGLPRCSPYRRRGRLGSRFDLSHGRRAAACCAVQTLCPRQFSGFAGGANVYRHVERASWNAPWYLRHHVKLHPTRPRAGPSA